MIALPYGCHISTPSVFPRNWNHTKLSKAEKEKLLATKWRLQFRFHDPSIKEGPFAKGRLLIVKGFNDATVEARRASVATILDFELNKLKSGYNPITKQHIAPVETFYEIVPTTPLVDALRAALEKVDITPNMRVDITSKLKYLEQAAYQLRLNSLAIKDVRRKHMRALLDQIASSRKQTFTNNTYNSYLAHLRILFSELLEWEAAETNPISDMKKRKWTRKPQRILTPEECGLIDDFVYRYDKCFHRLIHIFFHSGARTTELFEIQGKQVDLKNQRFTVFIKKGRGGRWVEKPIQNVVLPFWIEAMQGCGPKDFVFSKGLKPGPLAISAKQAHKRWARHIQGKRLGAREQNRKQIKEKLHIDCSWYRLKHLHTDRTAAKYGIGLAAAQNSHQSLLVTMNYAVGEKERQLEQQKANDVKFAG